MRSAFKNNYPDKFAIIDMIVLAELFFGIILDSA